ncbi:MAG: hypothetical protein ACRDC4_13065 [Plesiomonas sp.]
MADKVLVGVVSTVVAGVVTAGILSGVSVYGEVESLKTQVAHNKSELDARNRNDEHFQVFINQMDKSLAIQTEAVKGIKQAVDRLENAVFTLKGEEK